MLRRLTLLENAQVHARALCPLTMEPIKSPTPTRFSLHLHGVGVGHSFPLAAWVRASGLHDHDVLCETGIYQATPSARALALRPTARTWCRK